MLKTVRAVEISLRVTVDSFVELKVGTPAGNYWLPVVTLAAEPQEGGGIARAWIIDPKVYPDIPLAMFVFRPEGTLVATGGHFVFSFVKLTTFILYIYISIHIYIYYTK